MFTMINRNHHRAARITFLFAPAPLSAQALTYDVEGQSATAVGD
jgi:hypothetical protein